MHLNIHRYKGIRKNATFSGTPWDRMAWFKMNANIIAVQNVFVTDGVIRVGNIVHIVACNEFFYRMLVSYYFTYLSRLSECYGQIVLLSVQGWIQTVVQEGVPAHSRGRLPNILIKISL